MPAAGLGAGVVAAAAGGFAGAAGAGLAGAAAAGGAGAGLAGAGGVLLESLGVFGVEGEGGEGGFDEAVVAELVGFWDVVDELDELVVVGELFGRNERKGKNGI